VKIDGSSIGDMTIRAGTGYGIDASNTGTGGVTITIQM